MEDKSKPFALWRQEFHRKIVPQSTVESGTKVIKISTLFSDVRSIKLSWGTHDQLIRNLEYACYCASKAPDPALDANADLRREIRADFTTIQELRVVVDRLLSYWPKHRRLFDSAFKNVTAQKRKVLYQSSPYPNDEAGDLFELVGDLSAGLSIIGDEKSQKDLNIENFICGPFYLDIDVERRSIQLKNINQTGLIFHLAYLFRMFTAQALAEKYVQVQDTDIVIVDGKRLRVGRPHYPHVAALVNATFPSPRPLNPKAAMYRLRDLYPRRPKSKTKVKSGGKTKRYPTFVGWK